MFVSPLLLILCTAFFKLPLQASHIATIKIITIMRFTQALPVLALVAPALCQGEVASIISELGPLITELPSIISEEGGALLTDLANLIS
jgi:hypothetical protein